MCIIFLSYLWSTKCFCDLTYQNTLGKRIPFSDKHLLFSKKDSYKTEEVTFECVDKIARGHEIYMTVWALVNGHFDTPDFVRGPNQKVKNTKFDLFNQMTMVNITNSLDCSYLANCFCALDRIVPVLGTLDPLHFLGSWCGCCFFVRLVHDSQVVSEPWRSGSSAEIGLQPLIWKYQLSLLIFWTLFLICFVDIWALRIDDDTLQSLCSPWCM